MVVEIYLDGTLLNDEPEGLRNLTETMERDNIFHGYISKFDDIDLVFFGDGYLFIKNKIKTNGYGSKVLIDILLKDLGGYTDTIRASFFTTDVELDATENTYSVSLENENFGSFIKSGAKEKITPTANLSRNEVSIAPVTPIGITMFTPSTGVNLATDAKCLDLIDILEHQVAYLSDGEITFFDSSSIQTGPINYAITKHYYIQTRGDNPNNQISFQELMEFIWRAFGVMFWIDIETEVPVFNIADENDLMETPDGSLLFEQVKNLKLTFDQEIMYSTVLLGSDKENVDKGGLLYTLPQTPLIGFGEESVNSRSDSMLPQEFDLRLEKFIAGTNKIEQLLSSTSYIENNIIIQYTSIGNNASKGTYGKSGSSRCYNENLLNVNVLENHNFPAQLVSEVSTETEAFQAFITADTSVPFDTNPFLFDDDSSLGFDTGANYVPATGEYTVPATGVYIFGVDVWLHTTSLSHTGVLNNSVSLDIYIYRNGSIILTKAFVVFGTGETPVKKATSIQAFFETGDIIKVRIATAFGYTGINGTNTSVVKGKFITISDAGNFSFLTATNFNTQFVFNSGGAVITPDVFDYPAVNYDFKYNIDLASWKSIRTRPIQGFIVDTNGQNKSNAWLKKISRNWINGESEVTLFTKLSENNI